MSIKNQHKSIQKTFPKTKFVNGSERAILNLMTSRIKVRRLNKEWHVVPFIFLYWFHLERNGSLRKSRKSHSIIN